MVEGRVQVAVLPVKTYNPLSDKVTAVPVIVAETGIVEGIEYQFKVPEPSV
jgi:hypothetical protein